MKTAKDIFLKALELDSTDGRTEFVQRECGSDVSLRRRVDALLAAHDDPESYLDRPAARFDVTATHDRDGRGASLSDSSSHHGRFLPGTKLAGRYRIVSLLGRGGMGEVYRADDLKLGQTVALKFLPPELVHDSKRLEYFHNEVRLARHISHPNVCRVYDIGEFEGQHFISMEYIDGEDLRTLLNRIGRFPGDRGITIAQQLCAGLEAAHCRGVLHRDLKPANIMVDGQGQVRITDFGLATVAGTDGMITGLSGTPAYMAPEQLLRGESSVQTDIYSLGLVLVEVFTGKPAHEVKSLEELRRLHDESSHVRQPSEQIHDIDTAVERGIMRCLQPDTFNRPKSVAEVAASLPGGNPLAAAIAAGETPSPALVAAAGGEGSVSQPVAAVGMLLLIASIISVYFCSPWTHLAAKQPIYRAPYLLADDARGMLEELGYDSKIRDSGYGLWLTQNAEMDPRGGWTSRGDTLRFWYRQAAEIMVPNKATWGAVKPHVTFVSPAWDQPEMRGLEFNRDGKFAGCVSFHPTAYPQILRPDQERGRGLSGTSGLAKND